MLYEATIDDDSLLMFDRTTGQALDAVAVIPSHQPDLAALVKLVPPEMLEDLALMVMQRAASDGPVPGLT